MASLTKFSLDETVAVLGRTPPILNALLRGLPNTWAHCNEGKDTWSAFDIVGHLIFGERTDWMPRLRIILEHGDVRPFDPFDRFAQFKDSQDKSLEQLLDDFGRLRSENLAALQRWTAGCGAPCLRAGCFSSIHRQKDFVHERFERGRSRVRCRALFEHPHVARIERISHLQQ